MANITDLNVFEHHNQMRPLSKRKRRKRTHGLCSLWVELAWFLLNKWMRGSSNPTTSPMSSTTNLFEITWTFSGKLDGSTRQKEEETGGDGEVCYYPTKWWKTCSMRSLMPDERTSNGIPLVSSSERNSEKPSRQAIFAFFTYKNERLEIEAATGRGGIWCHVGKDGFVDLLLDDQVVWFVPPVNNHFRLLLFRYLWILPHKVGWALAPRKGKDETAGSGRQKAKSWY